MAACLVLAGYDAQIGMICARALIPEVPLSVVQRCPGRAAQGEGGVKCDSGRAWRA
jgi:hypothetical protein